MTDNIFGIILAGGRGSRMGNAERPKQFLEIGGKPIIVHTIEKFAVHPDFVMIIVLCPKAISIRSPTLTSYEARAGFPLTETRPASHASFATVLRFIRRDTFRYLSSLIPC